MIISRTPLRISFVGGGSDIESFYRHQAGAVVSTTINKYIYIAVNHQFDGRIILNYSKTEIVRKVEDIENNLMREALRTTKIQDGIHITSIADVPSEGTGVGSSSSYIVGLLNALYAYKGKYVSAESLARKACKIEIDILRKPIGKQDQYAAAYGGFNHIQFNPDGTVFVNPIICLSVTKRKLERKLLLLYTGLMRSADSILTKQTKNMINKIQKRKIMSKMVELAKKMYRELSGNNLDLFGKLLHENWMLKREMADGITNSQIDKWYKIARENGAIGGKILGAGGGGFLLFYASEDKHERIIHALPELLPLKFRFEPQGSKIIFIDLNREHDEDN